MQVEIQNLNKFYANGPEKDLKFHLENGNDCEEQCRRQKCNRKNIISNNISTRERGNGSDERGSVNVEQEDSTSVRNVAKGQQIRVMQRII